MINKLYYGAAYYPELWDEETITKDIEHMKKIGINVVRMGEFAWANMEPDEDNIKLDFFISIINRLHDNNIETIMCTPTPTPPRWMTYGHQERCHVNEDRATMSHGGRQHICTNNSYFRSRADIITEAIGKACGNLPGVIGWQIDNEFKCGVSECFCDSCKSLWHSWLKEKYGTISNLNEKWGTAIWSQRYSSFSEIPQPTKVPARHNASLSTMYRLFHREKIAEFCHSQAKIIRQYSNAPITHNTSIGYKVDNEILFEQLDIASFDDYADYDNYQKMIWNYDLWRNTKKNMPFWVMETSPYHNGGLHHHAKMHREKYLIAEVVAAYALGATGFSYWLWRQQRTGCELPHGAILSTWGEPTIGYKEVLEASKVREKIEPWIMKTKPVKAELAITYSDRARTYFMTEDFENINYLKSFRELYDIILNTGIHRDILFEKASLENYKLLLTPMIPYLSNEYIERAVNFVESGGIWIVGPMSGMRTGEHTVHVDAGLGILDKITRVKTLYTYHMTESDTYGTAFGTKSELGGWAAVFEAQNAEIIGTINTGPAKGNAFITESSIGLGKVVMLGALPVGDGGTDMISKLISHYAREADISLKTDVTPGTIVSIRRGEGIELWTVINMDGKGGELTLPSNFYDVLDDELVSGQLKLSEYEYKILERKAVIK